MANAKSKAVPAARKAAKRKSSKSVARKPRESRNPLLHDDVSDSLYNLEVFARFLASYTQKQFESGMSPTETESHGHHLAMMLLADGIEKVNDIVRPPMGRQP